MELKEILLREFEDIESRNLYKNILGTDSIREISDTLNFLVEKNNKSKISNVIFAEISIGCVFGFELKNKNKLVLKIFPQKVSEEYLIQIRNVQNEFYKNGFPCPKCLSGIEKIGKINYCFDEYIEGSCEDGHNDEIIEQLAKYLVFFTNLSKKIPLPNVFPSFKLPKGKIYPEGMNDKFKLNNSNGANNITVKARQARKIINNSSLPRIIGHCDWGVKNSRFKNKKLISVFDWDSLISMSEAEMVGNSAAQFTATWDIKTKVTPDKEESLKFIRFYEEYKGKKFSEEDYRIISASAEILVTYIARIEHKFNKIIDKEKTPYKYLVNSSGENFFLELNDLV